MSRENFQEEVGDSDSNLCQNCGQSIEAEYCSHCGQHRADHNAGLKALLLEFVDEFFRLDSKLFRTLKKLFLEPGALTQEWVAGKRIRYITPIKLYVTLSAIFFLALSFRNFQFVNINLSPKNSISGAQVSASESKRAEKVEGKITGLTSKERDLVKDRFFNHLPTTNFIIMPILAGILQLLHFRMKRYYVEHLVFTLHFYAFCFSVFSISLLTGSPVAVGIGFLAILVYFPLAIKRNYQQTWLTSLIKVAFFDVMYLLVIIIAMLGNLILAARDVERSKAIPSTVNPSNRG